MALLEPFACLKADFLDICKGRQGILISDFGIVHAVAIRHLQRFGHLPSDRCLEQDGLVLISVVAITLDCLFFFSGVPDLAYSGSDCPLLSPRYFPFD